MGSQTVGQDWVTFTFTFTFIVSWILWDTSSVTSSPVTMGTGTVKQLELCCLLLVTALSEARGSSAVVWGPELQIPFLLVPQICLFRYRCLEFSCLLMCWAKAPLLSCGCFTLCILKVRDKGKFLLCFVFDVILFPHSFFTVIIILLFP